MQRSKIYTKGQKNTLTVLLNKYEHSKAYKEGLEVTRISPIKPAAIMKDYDSDYADVVKINQFNSELEELESDGLIVLKKAGPGSNSISRIYAAVPRIKDYYDILNRTEKKLIQDEQLQRLKSLSPVQKIMQRFVIDQIERLESKKELMYSCDEIGILSQLGDLILENEEDLLERELSISFFGDSKRFENEYKSKICTILKRYGDYDDLFAENDSKTMEDHILLEEHNIYANPTYIYFKGAAVFKFESGFEVVAVPEAPMAFSSDAINKIVAVDLKSDAIMTVENKTTYHRLRDKNVFYIYLGGYHSSLQTRFLRKLDYCNKGKRWMHFGDIDPDGFYILEHLKKMTQIQFEPYLMGMNELERYKDYTKVLEKNDVIKANNLLEKNIHADIARYMLDYNCKLEQEIISLKEL